jgi:hypothetical protein
MSDMRDYQGVKHGMFSRLFGREYIKDGMHSTDALTYEWCLENAFKGSTETAYYLGGRPLIRGRMAEGGPAWAYKNTECVGGADAGTIDGGDFNNDFGVGLIQYIDTEDNHGMLWFDNLNVPPIAGTTLTQATTGATLVVSTTDVTNGQGWVMGRITGTFNTANTVTGPAAMLPNVIVPRRVSGEDTVEANKDTAIAIHTPAGADYTEMIKIGIRGIFETYFAGEPAGTGYNGIGVDGTDFTYNDDIDAYCKADYHFTGLQSTGDVDTGPDNVYGNLLASGDVANTDDVPAIVTAYHKHNEPNVYVGDDGSCQGTGFSDLRGQT